MYFVGEQEVGDPYITRVRVLRLEAFQANTPALLGHSRRR